MRIHPHDRVLGQLVGMVDDSEYCRLIDHLLGCTRCRRRLKNLLVPRQESLSVRVASMATWSAVEPDYGRAIQAMERQVQPTFFRVEKQRVEAVGLLTGLLRRPPGQRELVVRNTARFQSWGLLELIVERSRDEGRKDRQSGEDLAHLALALADALSGGNLDAEQLEDMRARIWSTLGNTLRVWSDLAGAERAFAAASSHLRAGTRDPLERALYLDLKASLMRAQRRFPEAIRLLRRAFSILQRIGDDHRAGLALVNLANVYHAACVPEQGIPLLYRSLDLIDPGEDPALVIGIWHNLMDLLVESGRFMEAQGLLIRVRPLYSRNPDPAFQSRLKWVSGKIARGLGQERKAESFLLAARAGFVRQGRAYETALVCLEVASLYVQQGRTAELKELAETMLPIFSSLRIHREALAALTLLSRAITTERASVALVSRVSRLVKGMQRDPALRLESLDPEPI